MQRGYIWCTIQATWGKGGSESLSPRQLWQKLWCESKRWTIAGEEREKTRRSHPWLSEVLLLWPLSPGRASLHGKASLQIDPVRSEDQGWYECRVLMLEQQYDTFHNGSWVHLTVNGESLFSRPGSYVSVGLKRRKKTTFSTGNAFSF